MKTKYHPILFSTPMVQAIDENRKNQTRRTKGLEEINKNPELYRYDGISTDEDDSYHGCYFFEYLDKEGKPLEKYHPIDCPYNVGDVFWVRETFFMSESYPGSDNPNVFYKAKNDFIGCNKWKPSLFMPKIACRTFLKIKSIRVERLQDISEEDAIAEGIEDFFQDDDSLSGTAFRNYMVTKKDLQNDHWSHIANDAIESFMTLWQKINGKDSWNKNPFVWVYEFEKIEKPLDFGV